MDDIVEQALASIVDAAQLQGRVVLVGGQAIVDWYSWMGHCDAIPPSLGPLAQPRATSDIDVYLQVQKNSPTAQQLATALEADWDHDPEQSFRYVWKQDSAISLDLVCGSPSDMAGRVQQLRVSRGSYLWRARVIPEALLQARLTTLCHRPLLAIRRVDRLNHAGLVGAKLAAVASVLRQLGSPADARNDGPDWTERLAKDLQDLDRLVAPVWVDRLCAWSHHVDGPLARRALKELADAVLAGPSGGVTSAEWTRCCLHARMVTQCVEMASSE